MIVTAIVLHVQAYAENARATRFNLLFQYLHFIMYTQADAEESGVLNVNAAANTLNLVLRDEGLMRFVKYVSFAAPGSRWEGRAGGGDKVLVREGGVVRQVTAVYGRMVVYGTASQGRTRMRVLHAGMES